MDITTFCCLFVVCIYVFGWLCRATYCSVVSTSMLGASRAIQNEKKLWKFTKSDSVYVCSAGYAELPIVLLYLLRCLVYHMPSKTRRNSRSLHRVMAYMYVRLVMPSYLSFCCIYFDAWCITCCSKREETLEVYTVIGEVLVLGLLVVY